MQSNKVVRIELELSTSQFEASIDKICNQIDGLEKLVESLNSQITELFSSVKTHTNILLGNLGQIVDPIIKLSESLNTLAASDFSALGEELASLEDALNNIFGQMEDQQEQDLATSVGSYIFSVAQLGWDIYDTLSERKSKSKANGKGTTKVTVRKKGTSSKAKGSKTGTNSKAKGSKTGVAGIAAGGIGTAMGLDALDGNMGDLLGDVSGTGSITSFLSNLSTAVSDASQKMKDFGSAIGTAFSSFGTTIGQIAASTGTWIANTAAKVGNTAAQWAQIAATTAWQGICAAATAVTTAFGAAMTFLTSPIGLVVIGIVALIAIIALLIANWDKVSAAVMNFMDILKNALEKFDAFVQGIFDVDWTEYFGAFGNVLNAFFANVENVWNAIKNIFSGIVSFVKNVFAGDWGAAWDSIVNVFKGIWDYLVAIVKAPINGIIGLINGLVQGVVDGINLVIRALNSVSFDIPDWVPLIGGQTFGFNLALLNAPKIPLLAQGAVLPANRPFLAMVGDQRHGTNIEAPLTTIQEAVATVMADYEAANLAGHEATVEVLRQLLAAVLGIEVGDTTIGQAANRYNQKMAVIKGGL